MRKVDKKKFVQGDLMNAMLEKTMKYKDQAKIDIDILKEEAHYGKNPTLKTEHKK